MNSDIIIALICKNESPYLREFLDYHFQLGFDKVILADNNDKYGERYEELLKPYIDKGLVEIWDYRGVKEAQKPFYNHIINDKPIEYEWCAFIDTDEFITFNGEVSYKSIKEFLHSVPEAKAYALNWMCFGDNGNITYSPEPSIIRFPKPMPFDFKFTYQFPENCHIKSILHYDVKGTQFTTVHNVDSYEGLQYYNGNREMCPTSPFQDINYKCLFIRHYYTKSLEEWINKKYGHVRADINPLGEKANYPLEDYFKYNEFTEEKKKFIESKGLKVPINMDTDIFIYSHVPFTPKVKNPVYKILTNNKNCGLPDFHTNLRIYFDYVGDSISDKNLIYNEYSGFYWILHNWELKKYVGMIHYRRYYNFYDDVPDIDKIFSFGFKIILNKAFPLAYKGVPKTNREFYKIWHNIEDFDLMEKIVKENYPQYADGWDAMSNATHIYPSSLFIMPTELFKTYINYAFDVMNKFNDARGCHTKEEWIQYVTDNQDKYIRPEHPYYNIVMQSRATGYLVERCLAAFLMSGGENSLENKSAQFEWSVIDDWK